MNVFFATRPMAPLVGCRPGDRQPFFTRQSLANSKDFFANDQLPSAHLVMVWIKANVNDHLFSFTPSSSPTLHIRCDILIFLAAREMADHSPGVQHRCER